jgi:hypothetical protein
MAASAVAAPSQMPSVVKHAPNSIGADAPIGASTTSRIYTSLTDVTELRYVPRNGWPTAATLVVIWLVLLDNCCLLVEYAFDDPAYAFERFASAEVTIRPRTSSHSA